MEIGEKLHRVVAPLVVTAGLLGGVACSNTGSEESRVYTPNPGILIPETPTTIAAKFGENLPSPDRDLSVEEVEVTVVEELQNFLHDAYLLIGPADIVSTDYYASSSVPYHERSIERDGLGVTVAAEAPGKEGSPQADEAGFVRVTMYRPGYMLDPAEREEYTSIDNPEGNEEIAKVSFLFTLGPGGPVTMFNGYTETRREFSTADPNLSPQERSDTLRYAYGVIQGIKSNIFGTEAS